jgi:16S rRNA (adenine1518-N6/adenine1519-N6)-dimethyltransferase
MELVRAKKHLGQHFLNDESIAFEIVNALNEKCTTKNVLEVGPGMGVLTQYLLKNESFQTCAIDIDLESVKWLKEHFPALQERLILGDFLQINFKDYFKSEFSLIGNFPYNISSQIIFRMIDCKEQIPLMVGMFQKEVAERLCGKPRTKDYGIISVITQAFFDVEYLITVPEHVFTPPPKVKSAVVRFIRKEVTLACDEKKFRQVVKTAFNQRRKKLRNGLSSFNISDEILKDYIDRRAEELSVDDFVNLTNLILANQS